VIWQGQSPADCERIAYDQHGRFVVPEECQNIAASLESEDILFRQPRHPEFVALYGGPLFVVIDGGTASASEQFATLLQYNRSATIVGEKSYGAGCGYTRGGIKLYLGNTELRVWMPDCVRIRADGENELSGIEPDVAGWKPGAKGTDRARSLFKVLRDLPTNKSVWRR
jgi:C-terminal processing protease CtpA/Prc